MSNAMPLQVTNLSVNNLGLGELTVQFESLAAYKATITRLHVGTILTDNHGAAHYLSLADIEHAQPPTFPEETRIPVIESELPADSVTRRMMFGNNYLQSGCLLHVIDFDPPSPAGEHGSLRAEVGSAKEYDEIRRFLDEEHGSALSSLDGTGQWYVHRLSDDGKPKAVFPQKVNFQIEWLRL